MKACFSKLDGSPAYRRSIAFAKWIFSELGKMKDAIDKGYVLGGDIQQTFVDYANSLREWVDRIERFDPHFDVPFDHWA